jgi:hypothetical protein
LILVFSALAWITHCSMPKWALASSLIISGDHRGS